MMATCSAYGCAFRTTRKSKKQKEYESLTGEEIRLYRFPANKELQDKWVREMRRENWVPNQSSRICSRHFPVTCFERFDSTVRLVPGSVPTIFTAFPLHLQKVYEDVNNYLRCKMVGGHMRVKPGAVPHKFECQRKAKTLVATQSVPIRKFPKKKMQAELINNLLEGHGVEVKQEQDGEENWSFVETAPIKKELVQEELQLDYEEIKQEEGLSSLSIQKIPVWNHGMPRIKTEVEEEIEGENERIQDNNYKDVSFEVKTELKVEPLEHIVDCYEGSCQNIVEVKDELQQNGQEVIEAKQEMDSGSDRTLDSCAEPGQFMAGIDDVPLENEDQSSSHSSTYYEEANRDIRLEDLEDPSQKDSLNIDRPHECSTCQKTFSHRSNLIEHLRIHNGDRPYSCETCQKCFSRVFLLKMHLRTHSGEKPFQCSSCEKSFSSKSNFKRHLLTHEETKQYQCSVCSKAYSDNSMFKIHLLTHSDEKPFRCEICSKEFVRSSNYLVHVRMHKGEKPFECEICSRRFFLNNQLVRHSRTHTGIKPYACKSCNKCFNDSSHLKRHSRTHSGEKPYKCVTCEKLFSNSTLLKKHVLTHSGERPHKCEKCNKGFVDARGLKKHVVIHGEKLFKCETCSKSFSTNFSLKKHLLSHIDKNRLND